MRNKLTKHARSKLCELDLMDVEAYRLVDESREATPEELATIFYSRAKLVHRQPDEDTVKHLVHPDRQLCFVTKDEKDIRIIITLYECKYLFQGKAKSHPIHSVNDEPLEGRGEELFRLYNEGHNIYLNKGTIKLCKVIKFKPHLSKTEGYYVEYETKDAIKKIDIDYLTKKQIIIGDL